MGKLYRDLRKTSLMERAWAVVRERGLSSASPSIRAETSEFAAQPSRNLRRIQGRLLKGRYSFSPQLGVPKRRPGKAPRPIVIATVEDRIVQRAMLDLLTSHPAIKRDVLSIETSVGGIKGVSGVEAAISQALGAIEGGCDWFIRSDISNFFTHIPRDRVSDYLREAVEDDLFTDLFDQAIRVRLVNEQQLGKDAAVFPLGELGVAQGSALSPLIGNILLRDFDRQMNGRGVVCLRYVDDFLILGRKKEQVVGAFRAGLQQLKALGLTAYDPTTAPEKAEMGRCRDGFDFLGCRVKDKSIRPCPKARTRLIERVAVILTEGRHQVRQTIEGDGNRARGVAQTLTDVDNVVRGWRDAYAFCTDKRDFGELDRRVTEQVAGFVHWARKATSTADEARRAYGVSLLAPKKRTGQQDAVWGNRVGDDAGDVRQVIQTTRILSVCERPEA